MEFQLKIIPTVDGNVVFFSTFRRLAIKLREDSIEENANFSSQRKTTTASKHKRYQQNVVF